MSFYKKKNNARTTLANGIDDTTNTIVVNDASSFPTEGNFVLTIWDKVAYPNPGDDPNVEITLVTGVSGNTFTALRAQEETSASSHATGQAAEMLITAGTLEDIESGISAALNEYTAGDGITLASNVISVDESGVDHNGLSNVLGGTYHTEQQFDTVNAESGETLYYDGSTWKNNDKFIYDDVNNVIKNKKLDVTDAGTGSGGSSANLLDDDCTSFTGWNNVGGTLETYQGDSTFNFTGNADRVLRTISTAANNRVATLSAYIVSSDIEEGIWYRYDVNATWGIELLVDSAGIKASSDGGSTWSLLAAYTHPGATTKFNFTVDIDTIAEDYDIYINTTQYVTGATIKRTSGLAEDRIIVGSVGTSPNIYYDKIQLGDSLESAGFQNLTNVLAVSDGSADIRATFINPITEHGIITDGKLEVQGDGQFGNDLNIVNDLTVENDATITGTLQAEQLNSTDDANISDALTVGGDLIVDTNTLYVDAASNFVGIKTLTPQAALDVAGDIRIESGYDLDIESGNIYIGEELLSDLANKNLKIGNYDLEIAGTGNPDRSTGDLLTETCDSLTGWLTSGEGGFSSSTQETFDSRETFRFYTSSATGAAKYAHRYKDIGDFSGTQYFTFKMYHATMGLHLADDVRLQFSNGTNRLLLLLGTDGFWYYTGSGYSEAGSDAPPLASWYEFHVHINWSALTFSIYRNTEGATTSTVIAEDVTFGGTTGDADGLLRIFNYATDVATDTYVDEILFSDTLESTGNSPVTNTVMALSENIEQSFITTSDNKGNVFAQGKIYSQDDIRTDTDAYIGNDLYIEGDLIDFNSEDVKLVNDSDNFQILKAQSNLLDVHTANRLVANPSKAEMVMIGDSIAYGFGTTITIEDNIESYLGNTCINKGVNGDKIADVKTRLTADMLNLEPRFGIILVGTNDVDNGTTLSNFISDYTDVLNSMVGANIIPVICSIPPRDEFNTPDSELRDEFNTALYNLFKDYSTAYWVDLQYYMGQYRDESGVPANNLWDFITGYGAGDGVHLTNTGNIAVAKAIIESTNELYIYSPLTLGHDVNIAGNLIVGNIKSGDITIESGYDLELESGNIEASTVLEYISKETSAGDEGINISGELHVGRYFDGKEAVFGEGDSHTNGMKVFSTSDDVSYTDNTTAASSGGGSTYTVFNGTTTVGSTDYIGGDYPICGIKLKTATLTNPGTGAVVREYWNGSSWTTFTAMATDADSPYTQRGDNIGTVVGSEQVRFGSCDDQVKTTVNGVEKYWIRFRVTGALTSCGTVEQVKLHTNRFEINADGATEYFGSGVYAKDLNVLRFPLVGATPSDENISFASGLTLAYTDNGFNNSATDGFGGSIILPEGIDTSKPMSFRASYYVDGTATGDIEFQFDTVQVSLGDTLDGTLTYKSQQTDIQTISVASDKVLKVVTFDFNAENLIPGEAVAFKFYRDATAGNTDDTLAGNIVIVSFRVVGYFWKP